MDRTGRLRKPFVTTDTNGVFTEKEEEDPQSSSRVDQGAPPEYSPAPRYARPAPRYARTHARGAGGTDFFTFNYVNLNFVSICVNSSSARGQKNIRTFKVS